MSHNGIGLKGLAALINPADKPVGFIHEYRRFLGRCECGGNIRLMGSGKPRCTSCKKVGRFKCN